MLSPMYYTDKEGGEWLPLPAELMCLTTQEWVRIMAEAAVDVTTGTVSILKYPMHSLAFSNPNRDHFVRWDCHTGVLEITDPEAKGE